MSSNRDANGAPGEQETYAEHREALEATLFRPADGASTLVLELREGSLRRVGP